MGIETDDRAVHQAVVKLSVGTDLGVESLANEMLGVLLAADVGLPVQEPFFVEIEPDFIRSLRNLSQRDRLEASIPLAFGSAHAGRGWRTWLPTDRVPVAQCPAALAILALDAFIGNNDRRPSKPNLLTDGEDWRLIDHEAAFSFRLELFPRCAPWEAGNLEGMVKRGSSSEHLFAKRLKGLVGLNVRAIQGPWISLPDARFTEYEASLPDEWQQARPALRAAFDHLGQVRDRMGDCLTELERALS